MAKITELSRQVAELIAAGEVVERPSSVVKELIENSIDAGASKITVEIENGGITYIRITDDGCGIEKEDVRTAFLRNATSKILKAEDLFEISTLGFRGEALAAAAAVSRIDMLTKTADSENGVHISVEGGVIGEPEDAGCPNGTTIVVRDLFFNTPARLKFMKRDATEAGYVASVTAHAALSRPDIAFRFIKNGKQELQTPGDGNLSSAIYAVYGRDYSFSLLDVAYECEGITVSGVVTKPENSRANRSMQDFFVNGRHIFSKTLCAALEQAYRGRIMTGRYPCCTLNISASPVMFDVNVHPAKTEIKFSDERRVFNALYRAVKSALDADLSKTDAHILSNAGSIGGNSVGSAMNGAHDKPEARDVRSNYAAGAPGVSETRRDGQNRTAAEQMKISEFYGKRGVLIDGPQGYMRDGTENAGGEIGAGSGGLQQVSGHSAEEYIERLEQKMAEEPVEQPEFMRERGDEQSVRQANRDFPTTNTPGNISDGVQKCDEPENDEDGQNYKVIGELFKTYIVVEQGDGAVIIDKHAAHERIIFNQMDKDGEAPMQLLLEPYILSLSPEEASLLLQNRDLLEKVGYAAEEFGIGTIAVRQIPVYTSEQDIAPILTELAGKLKNGRLSRPELLTRIFEKIACTAAVKANSFTDEAERDAFAAKLMAMPEIKYCPHGRPVAVRLTKHELEKMFKRV